ncbi:MAG: 30S ribosomal protein S3 [candidate division NC10 bacterium]|jgi:small subunit ribosomal protein S3|nr:30S ribosomal protein S3 [candidate division NC10 bacterium]
MGQKVHPVGFRLGYIKTWKSRWFATRSYADQLHEDLRIRRYLKERLYHAGISRILFERKANQIRIIVHAARPGIIIGRKGSEVDKVRQELAAMTDKEIHLDITEVRKAETDAQLVAENIAAQLERRVAFRRTMKKAVQSAMRLGAQGVKVMVAGRLGGSEIARTEWYREGRVPLHTLRADIDYGLAEARTTYGRIGVKAWIFHGEVMPETVGAVDERRTGLDVPEERERRRKKVAAGP